MTLDELEKDGYIRKLPVDKRHSTIYDTAGAISEREAENAMERAKKLVHEIERILDGGRE